MRREYTETKRTLYKVDTDMRLRCGRGPQGYREEVPKVLGELDALERRTVGLPTEVRAELRSIQESIERRAAELASTDADGFR